MKDVSAGSRKRQYESDGRGPAKQRGRNRCKTANCHGSGDHFVSLAEKQGDAKQKTYLRFRHEKTPAEAGQDVVSVVKRVDHQNDQRQIDNPELLEPEGVLERASKEKTGRRDKESVGNRPAKVFSESEKGPNNQQQGGNLQSKENVGCRFPGKDRKGKKECVFPRGIGMNHFCLAGFGRPVETVIGFMSDFPAPDIKWIDARFQAFHFIVSDGKITPDMIGREQYVACCLDKDNERKNENDHSQQVGAAANRSFLRQANLEVGEVGRGEWRIIWLHGILSRC